MKMRSLLSLSSALCSVAQEEGLHETHLLIEDEDERAEVKLRSTLEELASSCLKYVAITKNCQTGPGTGKTKLDKERMKLCEREIVMNARLLNANNFDKLFCLKLNRRLMGIWLGIFVH